MFIVDYKNYNDINSDYTKEMYEYNECKNNKYPIIILVPSHETIIFNEPRRHNEVELLIVKISLEEVINDVIDGENEVLDKIYSIIENKSIRKLSIK